MKRIRSNEAAGVTGGGDSFLEIVRRLLKKLGSAGLGGGRGPVY